MAKTIVTKYHGATNTKGSRISATAEDGRSKSHRVSIPYPHELTHDEAHAAAARALCQKMGWHGELICGRLPDGSGVVWVFANSSETHSV